MKLSDKLLSFMAKHNQLGANQMDLIWACITGEVTSEEEMRVLYDVRY